MRERFISWNPSNNSKRILEHVQIILDTYDKQGYVLTLRQLYYQLVSRDIIPNKTTEYKKLGNIVSNGRLCGLIDWRMIEDRVRVPVKNTHWESPQQILNAAINGYYRDKWEFQDNYIEVWCEKDAVSNIIQPICKMYDVIFMANRGYSSQSAMYNAHLRIAEKMGEGKNPFIIYLGDHDPSGIDMSNDIEKRLGLFLFGQDRIFNGVLRIALNLDQIKKYNPPENPAKITDSRYESYEKKYGKSSWELDALEPATLSKLVEDTINLYVDKDKMKKVERVEKQHKNKLNKLKELL